MAWHIVEYAENGRSVEWFQPVESSETGGMLLKSDVVVVKDLASSSLDSESLAERMRIVHNGTSSILDGIHRSQDEVLQVRMWSDSCSKLFPFGVLYCCDISNRKYMLGVSYDTMINRASIWRLVNREEFQSMEGVIRRGIEERMIAKDKYENIMFSTSRVQARKDKGKTRRYLECSVRFGWNLDCKCPINFEGIKRWTAVIF